MAKITEEVLKDPENDFPKRTVTHKMCAFSLIIVAVKRKYEAERRLLRESELAKYEQRKLWMRSQIYIYG